MNTKMPPTPPTVPPTPPTGSVGGMGSASTGSGMGAVYGGGRRGASVKTLKRMLKKAGLKTSGRKAALTRRIKKNHLKVGGGDVEPVVNNEMGGRRRGRQVRGTKGKLFGVKLY